MVRFLLTVDQIVTNDVENLIFSYIWAEHKKTNGQTDIILNVKTKM